MSLSERYREAVRLALDIEGLNGMLKDIRQDTSSKHIRGEIHHYRTSDGVAVSMPRTTALRLLNLTLADKQAQLDELKKGLK